MCVRLRPWCKGQWKFDRMLMAVYFLVQDVDFYYTPLLLCFLKSTFTAFEITVKTQTITVKTQSTHSDSKDTERVISHHCLINIRGDSNVTSPQLLASILKVTKL